MSPLGFSRLGPRSKKKEKRMKKNIFSILSFFVVAILLISCGGRSQNRKLVQAQEIHKEMMMKYDSIYNALEVQEKRVTKKLESMKGQDPDRAAFQSMQRSIQRSYNLLKSWNDGVTNVPGFEPDQSGNDEHPNTSDLNPKELSDQEILDLQNAYSEKLDQISQKIDELITTMDMYTGQ